MDSIIKAMKQLGWKVSASTENVNVNVNMFRKGKRQIYVEKDGSDVLLHSILTIPPEIEDVWGVHKMMRSYIEDPERYSALFWTGNRNDMLQVQAGGSDKLVR